MVKIRVFGVKSLPDYCQKLQKGFGSLYEFAAKLAGISHEQVRLAINIDKDFDDKPALKLLFVNDEVSMNKLASVRSVVTSENQDF